MCIEWYWEEWDAETGQLLSSEYMYTSCYECEGGGGGPGGSPDPCAVESNNLEENSAEIGDKISVVICAETGAIRTKCYTWRSFKLSNGILSLYVLSVEKGVLQSTGPNIWEYNSFTHTSNSFEGVSVGYTTTLTGEDNTPSIYTVTTNKDWAKMYLTYTVHADGNCNGVPVSYSHLAQPYQTWHSLNN